MARQAIKSKREFNFIDASTGLKIDFIVGPDDEFTRLKFQRRKSKTISGQKVYFISPEDLILSKLLWYQVLKYRVKIWIGITWNNGRGNWKYGGHCGDCGKKCKKCHGQ